ALFTFLDARTEVLPHYFATRSPCHALFRKYDTPAFLKAASFVERLIDSSGGRVMPF
ncbi:hypothetical protein HK405_005376, partial [Cladochytrium tenue]